MAEQQCAWCQKRDTALQHCARCEKSYYCSKSCQKDHWVLHKTRCKTQKNGGLLTTMDEVNQMLAGLTNAHNPHKREACTKVLGCLDPSPLFWSQFLQVRASDVHGQGVFATRSLPPGGVLTSYPCHLLSEGLAVERICEGAVDASPENLQRMADTYSYNLRGTLLIGLPERHSDQRLLGHMLNDGCLVDVFRDTPLDALRDRDTHARLLKLYYANVLRHCNCKFRQDALALTVCVVSTRAIAPGEELLLSYGLSYWLDHNYGARADQRNPFLLQNMLALRETDAELRALFDESVRRDCATLVGQ